MDSRSDSPVPGVRPVPTWFSDAKLGIFIHWGLYSIPAFADDTHNTFAGFMGDLSAMRDTRGRNPYAEWYLNALRIPGSPTAAHHAATYGDDFRYVDFRQQFDRSASQVDFDEWADLFATIGADYVVMVTRHLDGYPLWPTAVTNPHAAADYRSRRDLVGDLTAAVRKRGLRMGLYYAGGTDWTFTRRPIRTMTDLMEQQALGPEYAAYASAQWRELIERYRPSILWNDMGWPNESDPNDLFAHYYQIVADGIVNDRWTQLKLPRNRLARRIYLAVVGATLRLMAKSGRAIPAPPIKNHYDVRTYEYEVPATPDGTWELTRGLGNSFGYNAEETDADLLTGVELIRLFVDVVARGGRLLLNVGPDGAGRIPDVQQRPLRELGEWLRVHRDAIVGTRPWTTNIATTTDSLPVRLTEKDGTVYVIVLADLPGQIRIPGLVLPPAAQATLLSTGARVDWRQSDGGAELALPVMTGPAQVVAIR